MKLILYIKLLTILFNFTSCKQRDKNIINSNLNKSETKYDSIKMDTLSETLKFKQENILLSVQPNVFTTSSIGKAKLKLVNKLGKSLLYDDRYFVEFYSKNTWIRLNIFEGLMFYDMAYVLPPGKSNEININLNPQHYEYKTGTYRILKVFTSQLEKQKLNATTEFFIE